MLRLQCPHISSWQRLLRLWLRRLTIYYVPVCLTVLSISVLGPLLCIIHCHFLLDSFDTSSTTSAQSLYFCHFLVTTDAEVKPTPLPLLPGNVYPFTLVGLGSMAFLRLLSTRYSYRLSCRNSQTIYLPPTPPPRSILLLSY
ncbi:MAG: hypothetical protein AAGF95_34260 [Chloroflexota bacterium]